MPDEWREQFDRDGFVCVPDFLPREEFDRLRAKLFAEELSSRMHQQGDTVTRRTPINGQLRRDVPELDSLLKDGRWRGLLAYVGTTASVPLYYLQTVFGGVAEGTPDPQIELHSDTFHPSMKAWLFLTDVSERGRPLTYVPGSHRLTPERVAWERAKSIKVRDDGDRLSQRGSFRVRLDELPALGLSNPRHFVVRANTLVVIDTCGFHARADSDEPTTRAEIWAYSRRTPFLPWTGGDPFSFPGIADERANAVARLVDWLAKCGLKQQQWAKVGKKRLLEL